LSDVGHDPVTPIEVGVDLRWSRVTGPDAIKVIDRDWVRYVRMFILLVAVAITWQVLSWQEGNYEAAALRAAGAFVGRPIPTAATATTASPLALPTVRAPVPGFTIALPTLRPTSSAAGPSTTPESQVRPPSEYVVKPGDNLFRIGLNNNVAYQTLAQLNSIPAPYTVYPGQVIALP